MVENCEAIILEDAELLAGVLFQAHSFTALIFLIIGLIFGHIFSNLGYFKSICSVLVKNGSFLIWNHSPIPYDPDLPFCCECSSSIPKDMPFAESRTNHPDDRHIGFICGKCAAGPLWKSS